MSVNKYSPHILVLPEDAANASIATGFFLHSQINERSCQILTPAGGWVAVLDKFNTTYVPTMRQFQDRRVVLLIDFDRDENRLDHIKQKHIPDDIKNRTFILGVLSNPEELKRSLKKNFEIIGETLSDNCSKNIDELWEHDLLKHNSTELERMTSSIKPFLFNQAE